MVLKPISSSIKIKVYKKNQRLANDPNKFRNFLQENPFPFPLFLFFPKSPFQDTRPVKIAIAEKCMDERLTTAETRRTEHKQKDMAYRQRQDKSGIKQRHKENTDRGLVERC